jgi:hypothetical protein
MQAITARQKVDVAAEADRLPAEIQQLLERLDEVARRVQGMPTAS